MRYWLVIFCCTFIGFQAHSTVSPHLIYHQNITKAEELLIAENYNESLKIYAEAIQYDHPFLYDFLLPLQAAVTINDSLSFTQYVEGLRLSNGIKKGLNEVFESKLEQWNKDWERRLFQTKDYRVDTVYQVLIDSLFECDQMERGEVYDTFFLKRKKAEKKWDQHSYERIGAFVNEAEKNGFPTECQMGINQKYFYHRDLMAIFYHYPQTYSCFKAFFDSWLASGKLHPRHFAWIVDFEERHLGRKQQKKSFYTYGFFAEFDPKFDLKKIKKTKLVAVNKNRLTIGLPKIEHDLKLSAFANKKRYYRPAFL